MSRPEMQQVWVDVRRSSKANAMSRRKRKQSNEAIENAVSDVSQTSDHGISECETPSQTKNDIVKKTISARKQTWGSRLLSFGDLRQTLRQETVAAKGGGSTIFGHRSGLGQETLIRDDMTVVQIVVVTQE